MPRKTSPLEIQLDRVADLRRQAPTAEGRAEITNYLGSKWNLVVAKAARVAGEWKAEECTAALTAAFERFMIKPESSDKRCEAKVAIVKALCEIETLSPAVFLRGIHHVQMEPEWGGSVDTAPPVRAWSAIGLAQSGYRDAVGEILPLLLDREREARIGGVRAISAAGDAGGILLLRFKALSGDSEPEVLGECFAALLGMEPVKSVGFVAGFMHHADVAVAEAAVLALGDSRMEEAFPILREALADRSAAVLRRTVLLAMALLRREAAVDFLIDQVQNGEDDMATGAAEALATYAEDPKIQERLRQARAARK